MIQALLDSPERERFDLTSLERLYYGAMPMPETIAKWPIRSGADRWLPFSEKECLSCRPPQATSR